MDYINFINSVIHNNVFYQKYYSDFLAGENLVTDKNFYNLPILEKKDIRAYSSDILSRAGNSKSLKKISTSGTTGLPLNIYWKKSEFIKSNFYTWKFRHLWYGITPADKYCTFHSVLVDGDSSIFNDVLLYEDGRVLSLGRYKYTEDVLRKYVEYINDFKPTWILGQPSVVYLLSQYISRYNISLKSIKYIELNGEFVNKSVYNSIKKVFNVPISNLYGSVEFNGIALTCPCGSMHILDGNVYLEEDCENYSNLIVTGLLNTYMPLIRYNIGDSGKITKDFQCNCGVRGDVLELYRGRSHELIHCSQELKIDPVVFTNIIDELNCSEDVILRYSLLVGEDVIILVLCIDVKYINFVLSRKAYLINKLNAFVPLKYKFDIQIETIEQNVMDSISKYTFVKNI